MPDPIPNYLTTKEAAPLIGSTEDWLIRNREQGPPWYRIGGRIKYIREEILDWLKTCRCQ